VSAVRGAVRYILAHIEAVIAAFQFLTRLPLPNQLPSSVSILPRSVVYYPFVGLVIGLIVSCTGYLLLNVIPVPIIAVLLTILWVALTGGLHMDGLMDTADGLLSHRSKERMLEIMRDSRVGAMGVLAGVFSILLKIVLIYALLDQALAYLILGLVIATIWSRTFTVVAIVRYPYAREGQGLGQLVQSAKHKHAVGATLLACMLTLSLLLITDFASWPLALIYTLLVLSIALIIGIVIAARISRQLGGLTGDVYGALIEVTEIGWMLLLIVYFQYV
jgi:adenosylcobinamide-GDP ribazoletransferase